MNKLVNKVENKLLEDFNTLEMSIQKCSMNEGNEGSGAYVELYTIFKHLYPSMRDAFDDILEAKSEKYQNIQNKELHFFYRNKKISYKTECKI